jgi:hypothetical protein
MVVSRNGTWASQFELESGKSPSGASRDIENFPVTAMRVGPVVAMGSAQSWQTTCSHAETVAKAPRHPDHIKAPLGPADPA